MSNHESTNNSVPLLDTRLNRRAFMGRALVGAGTLVASGAALGAWSRAANATAAVPGMHMPGHNMASMGATSLRTTDDIPQVNEQKPEVTAGVVDMDGEYYKSVRRPAKPGAKPQLDEKQIDELERHMSCPCPCNLDVFTCRTTDFACGNSPAVHRDVQALVAGGYSGDEIMQAMIGTYGNNILMAPPKEGVNLIAWFGPFVALGLGAIGINALLRQWRRNADRTAALATAGAPMRMPDVNATDDEMARLRAALRDDSGK